jgi:hypothetical protein
MISLRLLFRLLMQHVHRAEPVLLLLTYERHLAVLRMLLAHLHCVELVQRQVPMNDQKSFLQ